MSSLMKIGELAKQTGLSILIEAAKSSTQFGRDRAFHLHGLFCCGMVKP